MAPGKKLNKMNKNETVLITGENGSLAKKVRDQLKQLGYNVITFTSRKNSTKKNSHYWNIEKKTLNLKVLKKCDHIIHLAGFSIIKPWTNKNKKLMYNSRVLSSRLLFNECEKNKISIKTFISASAIGYYNESSTDENHEESKPGNSWLSKLAQDWEKSANMFNGIGSRVINLRISLLIDKDSGFLNKLLPFMKIGIVPLVGGKNNRFEYIHIDDAVNFVIYSIKNSKINGPYNLASDNKINLFDFYKKITKSLSKKYLIIKIPNIIMKLILGERFKIINSNIKVSSKKIINSGFQFKFSKIIDIIKKI
ncbi:MAG: TIGR01777 family protein [Flavobacteriales bacterium]|nr:TIGR01777 family protein [Flavobacteriales bacterium]